MTQLRLLLTHPGGAHKDEFLACCLMLATTPLPIERREPSPEDLTDPTICVIDVGLTHDPASHNFDHHQFPKDHTPTCSLSLVLQHLGLYEDGRLFCEWIEPAEWFDCRGPIETARWLGIETSVLRQLFSPIDSTLLRRFSKSRSLYPGNPIWEVMRMIGEDLLSWIRGMRQQLDYVARHAQLWQLPSISGALGVLFMPRTDPLPEEPSQGLGRFIESRGLQSSVAALVYPDRRGSGYGLSRYEDHPGLDFTRIASAPEVHFAHARGFVAKTSATDPERLKELLLSAWVG